MKIMNNYCIKFDIIYLVTKKRIEWRTSFLAETHIEKCGGFTWYTVDELKVKVAQSYPVR